MLEVNLAFSLNLDWPLSHEDYPLVKKAEAAEVCRFTLEMWRLSLEMWTYNGHVETSPGVMETHPGAI